MNPKNFDERIHLAFHHYGKIGVDAELLSAEDKQTKHGEYTTVTVEVTVLDKELTQYADVWRFGGVTSHEKTPVPIGVRPIDRSRLIRAQTAVERLPPGFPLDRASCTLYWALSPSMSEPAYFICFEDVVFAIGAYTGNLIRE